MGLFDNTSGGLGTAAFAQGLGNVGAGLMNKGLGGNYIQSPDYMALMALKQKQEEEKKRQAIWAQQLGLGGQGLAPQGMGAPASGQQIGGQAALPRAPAPVSAPASAPVQQQPGRIGAMGNPLYGLGRRPPRFY